MGYNENLEEEIISFKHKASDSTFDDDMTLEEKFGTIKRMIISDSVPDVIEDGEIVFITI